MPVITKAQKRYSFFELSCDFHQTCLIGALSPDAPWARKRLQSHADQNAPFVISWQSNPTCTLCLKSSKIMHFSMFSHCFFHNSTVRQYCSCSFCRYLGVVPFLFYCRGKRKKTFYFVSERGKSHLVN